MLNKICLLFGTPSSGKSSLGNLLEKEYKYKHISVDDEDYRQAWKTAFKEVNEELDNTKFFGMHKITKLADDKKYKILYEKFKDQPKLVYDDIAIDIKKYYDNIRVILLYASPEKMAKNFNMRRIKGDPRYANAFNGFSNLYIKTNDKDKIDTISLPKFIDALMTYNRYLFENEKELTNFAKKIFEHMNIYDNKECYIKLRDKFNVDYIINTDSETKEEILKKIKIILEE